MVTTTTFRAATAWPAAGIPAGATLHLTVEGPSHPVMDRLRLAAEAMVRAKVGAQ
jgi:hypothetical protein